MKRKHFVKGYRKNKKQKRRSSDSYIPTSQMSRRSSTSSSNRRSSVDYGRRSSTSSGGLTGYTSARRSSGSSVGRALAGAAGAELGFIHNNVPGAVFGAKKALEFYDYQTTSKFTKQNLMTSFAGSFKKPSYKKPSYVEMAQMKGYTVASETYGKVTDPNSAYLTHSTYQSSYYAYTFVGAAIRKVFQKAGYPLQNKNANFPFFSPTDGSGFQLVYTVTNPSTGAVSIQSTYEPVVAETMTSLLIAFTMATHVTNYLNKADENEPHHLYFYSSDRNNLATNYRLAAMLDLSAEVVEFYSSSDLRVQNQSNATNVDSADIDRNDTQPLAGRIYNFNGEPRLKSQGLTTSGAANQEIKLQGVSFDGIRLMRSADFTSASYHNRPPAQLFNNCNATADVSLQPGQMKRGFISFKISGRLNRMFPKLRMEQFGGTPTAIVGVKCKAQMMVFEERMRTASTQNIVVAYESKIVVACILKTRPLNASLATLLNPAVLNKGP